VATHSVDIDLPVPSNEPNLPEVDPIKNKIVITEQDQVLWNGQPLDDSGLVANLQASLALPEEPELQYEPTAGASYDRSLRVLDIIKGSGVTRFGFVGNEQYRTFGT
jgi:biopolymer transport protein ExbD